MLCNVFSFFYSKCLKHISVEPCYALFVVATQILRFANTNLIIQKSCRFNVTFEPDLSTPCDDERQGISYVASVNGTYRVAYIILGCLVVALVAAWCDKAGKKHKQLIAYTIVGTALELICLCVQTYFWHWPPIVAVVSECFFRVAFFSYMGMITFAFMYICDTSGTENRTMRNTLLTAVEQFCKPVGKGLSGFLLRRLGFLRTYLITLAITITALIYATFFLKDISVTVNEKVRVSEVFSANRISECCRVLVRKRPGNRRLTINLLLMAYILGWFTFCGEDSIFYLYIRYRFQWNEEKFAAYTAYKLFGVMIGTIFCSIILSGLLKIHDGLIGAMAAFSDTLAVIGYFLATENWQLYLIPVTDIFHGVALSVCVSFSTKYLDELEFGRFFGFLSVLCSLVMFSVPLYSEFFKSTMDSLPSAVFLISIGTNSITFLLYRRKQKFITQLKKNPVERSDFLTTKPKTLDRRNMLLINTIILSIVFIFFGPCLMQGETIQPLAIANVSSETTTTVPTANDFVSSLSVIMKIPSENSPELIPDSNSTSNTFSIVRDINFTTDPIIGATRDYSTTDVLSSAPDSTTNSPTIEIHPTASNTPSTQTHTESTSNLVTAEPSRNSTLNILHTTTHHPPSTEIHPTASNTPSTDTRTESASDLVTGERSANSILNIEQESLNKSTTTICSGAENDVITKTVPTTSTEGRRTFPTPKDKTKTKQIRKKYIVIRVDIPTPNSGDRANVTVSVDTPVVESSDEENAEEQREMVAANGNNCSSGGTVDVTRSNSQQQQYFFHSGPLYFLLVVLSGSVILLVLTSIGFMFYVGMYCVDAKAYRKELRQRVGDRSQYNY